MQLNTTIKMLLIIMFAVVNVIGYRRVQSFYEDLLDNAGGDVSKLDEWTNHFFSNNMTYCEMTKKTKKCENKNAFKTIIEEKYFGKNNLISEQHKIIVHSDNYLQIDCKFTYQTIAGQIISESKTDDFYFDLDFKIVRYIVRNAVRNEETPKRMLLHAKPPCGTTPMNIEFVIDESGSINRGVGNENNYAESIDFVINLIEDSINRESKVAAMSFSTNNQILYRFNDNQDDRTDIINALDNEKSNYSAQWTDTYNALLVSVNEFTSQDIAASETNIIFLLTDGIPWCASDSSDPDCIDDVCAHKDELLDMISDAGVNLYIIGVTPAFNRTKLDCLVDETHQQRVFLIDDFTRRSFEQVEDAIATTVLCTSSPTTKPTKQPTTEPTKQPTTEPTRSPTNKPTAHPTTYEPTINPTRRPTTDKPTKSPTADPTEFPTAKPTKSPTPKPTTDKPTKYPTAKPSHWPSKSPTYKPTTNEPTRQPTTVEPTTTPTHKPTTDKPSKSPTADPTSDPTEVPTDKPTQSPTPKPTTDKPTKYPTYKPITSEPTTRKPTTKPTKSPTKCRESTPMNIEFVIDESGSINSGRGNGDNYAESIDFVINLIQHSINRESKVAAMSFSTHYEILHGFSDEQDGRRDIIDALENEKSDYFAQWTDTYNALKVGVNEFILNFIPRRDNNIIFLLTDGIPRCPDDGSDPDCIEDVCRNNKLRNKISGAGIDLYVIGVTPGFNREKIDCLVDETNGQKVFLIDDFSHESFKQVEADISNIVLCGTKSPTAKPTKPPSKRPTAKPTKRPTGKPCKSKSKSKSSSSSSSSSGSSSGSGSGSSSSSSSSNGKNKNKNKNNGSNKNKLIKNKNRSSS